MFIKVHWECIWGNTLERSQTNATYVTSSHASALRRHLKIHTGEKSNKCKQCNYASLYASDLKVHLKTHSGEKANKCNQCDYASSYAGNI